MDLRSGYPYFLVKNGLYQEAFSPLEEDHRTDVVVLGGGVSGALMAYELVNQGIECTVIDKRTPGQGSTSASTSLLQYEIDVRLYDLKKMIGKENAEAAYHYCSDSIDQLSAISDDIGFTDFKYCTSLYFAHTKSKVRDLRLELKSRKDAGFRVEFLDAGTLKKVYGFPSHGAILSHHAAKTDAYAFTQALHQRNQKRGAFVFEDTFVKNVTDSKSGITLRTDRGYFVKAKKVIYATGYEVMEQIDKPIVHLKSTYAIASQRISNLPEFLKHTLLWSTANPYLYLSEDHNRLIVGGRDDGKYDPRMRKLHLQERAQGLQQDFKKLFPSINFKTQFAWAGTFGSTNDGLPYIGPHPKRPNVYFALGFGGNGITFSVLAAKFIVEHLKYKSAIPAFFGFNR